MSITYAKYKEGETVRIVVVGEMKSDDKMSVTWVTTTNPSGEQQESWAGDSMLVTQVKFYAKYAETLDNWPVYRILPDDVVRVITAMENLSMKVDISGVPEYEYDPNVVY